MSEREGISFNRPFVDRGGYVNKQAQMVLLRLEDLIPIVGEGTPEASVDARLYRMYLDKTNQHLYIKFESAIGGDTKKGWYQI